MDDCTPIVYSCGTCYDIAVTSNNYTNISPFTELTQNFGNLEVTLTLTGANDVNQIFVGSLTTGFGEIFDFESTGGTITKTVGFYNNQGNGVDLGIYSASNGTTPFTPFVFNVCIGCPTVIPCTGNTDCYDCYNYTFTSSEAQTIYWTNCDGTQTSSAVTEGQVVNIVCAKECTVVGNGKLVDGATCGSGGNLCPSPTPTPTVTPTPAQPSIVIGTTINVTDTGYIKYLDSNGITQYVYISYLGNYTINVCHYANSIQPGIPFMDLASFNNVVYGTPCNVTPAVTPTPTKTSTPTVFFTQTPTPTTTNTPTNTQTSTSTPGLSQTPTQTQTGTPNGTPTSTPTQTQTSTNTPTSTPTNTPTNTTTNTPTTTATPGFVPTSTPTPTPTSTGNATPYNINVEWTITTNVLSNMTMVPVEGYTCTQGIYVGTEIYGTGGKTVVYPTTNVTNNGITRTNTAIVYGGLKYVNFGLVSSFANAPFQYVILKWYFQGTLINSSKAVLGGQSITDCSFYPNLQFAVPLQDGDTISLVIDAIPPSATPTTTPTATPTKVAATPLPTRTPTNTPTRTSGAYSSAGAFGGNDGGGTIPFASSYEACQAGQYGTVTSQNAYTIGGQTIANGVTISQGSVFLAWPAGWYYFTYVAPGVQNPTPQAIQINSSGVVTQIVNC